MLALQAILLSAVHPDDAVSVVTAVERMRAELAKFEDRLREKDRQISELGEHLRMQMQKKDDTIAGLTSALNTMQSADRVQMHFMMASDATQLVSAARFENITTALASRLQACETKIADLEVVVNQRDGNATTGGPILPRAAPVSCPPRPPSPSRPRDMPGRRLQSASNDLVNEVSITGPRAVISWNSQTPGLTPINCTGIGDGQLTCSGVLRADNFVTSDGTSLAAFASTMEATSRQLQHVMRTIAQITSPPAVPPPPGIPPLPPAPPAGPPLPPLAPLTTETHWGIQWYSNLIDRVGTYSPTPVNVGQAAFNAAFRSSSRFIIWRRMSNCNAFYVRRPGRATNTWNAHGNMIHCWVSRDWGSGATNTLGVDFDLYHVAGNAPFTLGAHANFDAFLNSLSRATSCNYDHCGVSSVASGNTFHPQPASGWPSDVGTSVETCPSPTGVCASGYAPDIRPGVGAFRDCGVCGGWITCGSGAYAFYIAAS